MTKLFCITTPYILWGYELQLDWCVEAYNPKDGNLVPSFFAHSSLTVSFTLTYNINHPYTVKAYKGHILHWVTMDIVLWSVEHIIGLYHSIQWQRNKRPHKLFIIWIISLQVCLLIELLIITMKTFNNASLIFLSMLVYMLVDQVVELVQSHPVTFFLKGHSRFLISNNESYWLLSFLFHLFLI